MARNGYHCVGKLRFPSRTAASRAKHGHTYRLKTYCCRHCGGWHNGNDEGYLSQDEMHARERRAQVEAMRLRERAETET